MKIEGENVVMSKDRMICIILNASRMSKKRFTEGVPLWSLVSSLTGQGCTTSTEICEQLGLKPCSSAGLPEAL